MTYNVFGGTLNLTQSINPDDNNRRNKISYKPPVAISQQQQNKNCWEQFSYLLQSSIFITDTNNLLHNL